MSLPIQNHDTSFHLFTSSCVFFIRVSTFFPHTGHAHFKCCLSVYHRELFDVGIKATDSTYYFFATHVNANRHTTLIQQTKLSLHSVLWHSDEHLAKKSHFKIVCRISQPSSWIGQQNHQLNSQDQMEFLLKGIRL